MTIMERVHNIVDTAWQDAKEGTPVEVVAELLHESVEDLDKRLIWETLSETIGADEDFIFVPDVNDMGLELLIRTRAELAI